MSSSILSVVGLAAGVFIVYKSLTNLIGDPNEVKPQKLHLFYGDDKLTNQQIQSSQPPLADIELKQVDHGLAHVTFGNAIFETNPLAFDKAQPKSIVHRSDLKLLK
jgi:hypothetical protein